MEQQVFIGSRSPLAQSSFPFFFVDTSQDYDDFERLYPGQYNFIFYRGLPVIVAPNGRILFWRSRKDERAERVFSAKDFSVGLFRRDEIYHACRYACLKETGLQFLCVYDYGRREFAVPQVLLEMVSLELQTHLIYLLRTPEGIAYKGFLYMREQKRIRLVTMNELVVRVVQPDHPLQFSGARYFHHARDTGSSGY